MELISQELSVKLYNNIVSHLEYIERLIPDEIQRYADENIKIEESAGLDTLITSVVYNYTNLKDNIKIKLEQLTSEVNYISRNLNTELHHYSCYILDSNDNEIYLMLDTDSVIKLYNRLTKLTEAREFYEQKLKDDKYLSDSIEFKEKLKNMLDFKEDN